MCILDQSNHSDRTHVYSLHIYHTNVNTKLSQTQLLHFNSLVSLPLTKIHKIWVTAVATPPPNPNFPLTPPPPATTAQPTTGPKTPPPTATSTSTSSHPPPPPPPPPKLPQHWAGSWAGPWRMYGLHTHSAASSAEANSA